MSDATDDLDTFNYFGTFTPVRDMEMPKNYWITKDGKEINFMDMETSHIKNCIKILQRKLDDRPPYIPYVGDSDIANDWVESDERHNEEIAEEISVTIEHFEKELKRRGEPIATPRKD